MFHNFFSTFSDRQVQFHSAALAFYMIIALPAFVVFFLSIAGLFIASDSLHLWLTSSGLVTQEVLTTMSSRIVQFSSFTTVFSALIMIWSGSAIFNRVQQGLRNMWQVEIAVDGGVRTFFANKLLAVIAALLFIVGIVILFLFTQVATILFTYIGDALPILPNIVSVAQFVQCILLVSVVTLMYALFGDSKVSWQLLLVGSSTVSIILLLLQFVFQSYIIHMAAVNWYGAAGYVIILLFSFYLVGLVFFSGAIAMYVLASMSKKLRITPRSYAHLAKGSLSLWDRIRKFF